jgi:hypothetical protein
MRYLIKRLLLCVAAGPVLLTAGEQHAAHVHGQAQLMLATDGDLLEVMLESPAANLLGFEQAPATDAQQNAWQQQQALLKSGRWLQLPVAAQCVLQQQQLNNPWAGAGQHADISISLSYKCTAPEVLAEVKLTLFTEAADLQRIAVQWVSGGQQGAATLSAKQPVLQLPGTE